MPPYAKRLTMSLPFIFIIPSHLICPQIVFLPLPFVSSSPGLGHRGAPIFFLNLAARCGMLIVVLEFCISYGVQPHVYEIAAAFRYNPVSNVIQLQRMSVSFPFEA